MIASVSQYISVHAPWLLTVMVVWVVAYFLVLRFLNIGVRRIPRSVRRVDAQCVPISVVVSAHNAERELPACVAALLALDYPRKLLQIVLVNDQSIDGTAAIIDATAAAHAHVIGLHASDPDKNASAIEQGFAAATGEWILTTSAMGTVQTAWARHLLGYADANTGIAGGALLVHASGWWGAVERMACALPQTLNFGLTGWGAPLACAGSNMAVRRSVYLDARELDTTEHSHAMDEFAVFRVARARKLAVHLYMDKATTVTLVGAPTAARLLIQHARWLSGVGRRGTSSNIPLMIVIVWGLGMSLFIMLGWLLDWRVWAAFLLLKTTHDFLMLRLQQKRLETPHHVRYLPLLELYQLVTFAILPVIFLFRERIGQKDHGYSVRHP